MSDGVDLRALVGVPVDHQHTDTAACCPDDNQACSNCAGPNQVPISLAVGDAGPEAVAWVDRADLAADTRGALAQVLHGIADEIARPTVTQ